MRDFTKKQLMYMSFYYFWIIFLVATILYDVVGSTVTGFTFGYIFALFYMIARTRSVLRLMEDLNDQRPED
jgi:ABC-type multidrug transport system permease subunit